MQESHGRSQPRPAAAAGAQPSAPPGGCRGRARPVAGDATRVEFPTDAPATRGDERFLVSVEHIRADDLPNAEWGVYLEPTSGEPVLVGTLPPVRHA